MRIKEIRKTVVNLHVDPVDLVVLLRDLVAHVRGHGLEVAQDAPHGLHVLLHLVLAGVVVDPVDVRAVGHHAPGARTRLTLDRLAVLGLGRGLPHRVVVTDLTRSSQLKIMDKEIAPKRVK